MNKKKQATEEPQTSKARPKRAYQKPSFKHEKVFETTALSCGKLDPTQGQCHTVQKAS